MYHSELERGHAARWRGLSVRPAISSVKSVKCFSRSRLFLQNVLVRIRSGSEIAQRSWGYGDVARRRPPQVDRQNVQTADGPPCYDFRAVVIADWPMIVQHTPRKSLKSGSSSVVERQLP